MPALLVGNCWNWGNQEQQMDGTTNEIKREIESNNALLRVFLVSEGKVREMEIEEYLVGVVAAEMPSSFHIEALKAQAVIARTYALEKRRETGGSGCKNHPGIDLCTDSSCCQAWEDINFSLAKWPAKEGPIYLQRVKEAVSATHNMVITYEGKPIEAVYHSTCGGTTEAAEAVWSGNKSAAYLKSVECSFCRHSPYFKKEIPMGLSTYAAALKNQEGILPVLGEGNIPLLEVKKRSSSGRTFCWRGNPPNAAGWRCYLAGATSTFFRWRTEMTNNIYHQRPWPWCRAMPVWCWTAWGGRKRL